MPDLSVLRTKLSPPRPPRHTLVRPRVEALLAEALEHRVTLVQASTGYGKSTALANLAAHKTRLFWYTASEGDADPQQFLAHAITAFRLGCPALPETPLVLLQDTYPGATRVAAEALLNALADLVHEPALFVIDDYHLAESEQVNALVDHLLAFLPPDLHAILSTRHPPALEHLVSWRARGQVLDLHRDALAFTRDEIATLFRDKYALALSPREVELIEVKTEGWPIALQLVWQEIRAKPRTDMAALLGPGSGSLETLFDYLAQNVLAQQPPAVQAWALQTAILRELDPAAAAAVCPETDSRAMIAYLAERDLFLIALAENRFRYHHLFHDFLREQAGRADPDGVAARHRRAADFYRQARNPDEALFHLLQARAFAETAAVIEEIGEGVLRAGRLDTLASWLDAIPADVVASHPLAMFLLGDLARLRSRFDDALAWYAQAERVWRAAHDIGGISRALRGRALVYLDTVRPAQAEALLEESLRLNDGLDDRAARARLLELLAENKVNMGKAEQAEALREQARTLREEGPSEDALSVRAKLRTGQLDRAREILEDWAQSEGDKPHPPRAHRETLLILSLVYAMQGRAADAWQTAQHALARASQLHSPFIAAVGQMRLGHAYQMCAGIGLPDGGEDPPGATACFSAALRCYEQAVTLGDQLAVRRTRAEARWGMTRAHGFSGDLDAARRDAAEGIEIGRSAGDAWIVALVQIALGAGLVLAGRDREALETLGDALAAFRACGDPFGATATRQWLALAHWHLNQHERALAHLDEALAIALARRYDYLVITRTLLGWQDARVAVPLLLEARRRGRHAAYVTRLLAAGGWDGVETHPGYQLRIQTLGSFRVWRGDVEVTAREWQRRKARELLQLFVTRRGRWIEREEIFELVWSAESPATAARDFKVALNALNKVLEPGRPADDPPAFIARQETAYGLRAGADLWIDAEEFTQLITRAENENDLELYRHALALYTDDYLVNDARYADWTIAERERLLARYLSAADRLAAELLGRGDYDQALAWCERVLARDRCWEHAYRLMMRAVAARGDPAQSRRIYERCVQTLRADLDAEPSAATEAVFRAAISRQPSVVRQDRETGDSE